MKTVWGPPLIFKWPRQRMGAQSPAPPQGEVGMKAMRGRGEKRIRSCWLFSPRNPYLFNHLTRKSDSRETQEVVK